MSESPEGAVSRLGSRIRAERVDQGLSVTELSERSGVGRATVADLERTARTPSLDTLAKIADGLGVAMPDLLTERREAPLITPVTGMDVKLLGAWIDDDIQVEVHRLRIRESIRRGPLRSGARGYLTVLGGTLMAGAPATPRRLTTGGQLAYSADQPHVLIPGGGPVEAVLVMRYPVTRGESPVP